MFDWHELGLNESQIRSISKSDDAEQSLIALKALAVFRQALIAIESMIGLERFEIFVKIAATIEEEAEQYSGYQEAKEKFHATIHSVIISKIEQILTTDLTSVVKVLEMAILQFDSLEVGQINILAMRDLLQSLEDIYDQA